MKFIPYARHHLTTADVNAALKVLRSDWLSQGPTVGRFEEAFAKYVEAPYAVAVSSGTAALHLACLASDFGKGDTVVTTPVTFIATANSALYTGADVKFSDIEPNYLGLDPALLRKAAGAGAKGALNVHFAGHPSRIGAPKSISKRPGFTVIEDACHALGAEYRAGGRWRRVGSCEEARFCAFSFHPVKHLTTGEGGMLTMRSKEDYERVKRLRSHGLERDASKWKDPAGASKSWYYEMQELGFNYRISDFQCALGLSQLARMDGIVKRRREIAAEYSRALSEIGWLGLPEESPAARSSYHLYVVRIDFQAIGLSRQAAMAALKDHGVGTQVHYMPVPFHPYYRRLNGKPEGLYPESERYYREALSLPLYPAMTRGDVRRVIEALKELGR